MIHTMTFRLSNADMKYVMFKLIDIQGLDVIDFMQSGETITVRYREPSLGPEEPEECLLCETLRQEGVSGKCCYCSDPLDR